MKNGDIFYHSYRFHDTKDQDGAHHPKVFIFLSFNSDCSSLIPYENSCMHFQTLNVSEIKKKKKKDQREIKRTNT
jgi:hypothetical protein